MDMQDWSGSTAFETSIRAIDLEVIRKEEPDRARAYIYLHDGGIVERAGYIDLETGEIVGENSHNPQGIKILLSISGTSILDIIRRMRSEEEG